MIDFIDVVSRNELKIYFIRHFILFYKRDLLIYGFM